MEPVAHSRRRRAGTVLCLVAVLAGGRAGAETISDPEDTGPKRAPVAPPLDTRTLWRGSASLRLALDPRHQSSSTSTVGPYHEEVMDLLGELRAELQHQLRPWLRLQAGGRLFYHLTARRPADPRASFRLFNGEVHRNDLEPELLDSGISVSWRWLSVDAGMITEVLGATDLTSPNDVLTVRDLRAGVTLDPEASRFPAPMLKAAAGLRGVTLMAAFLPLFVPHRVDLYGTDFALLGPLGPDVLQWVGAFADGLLDDSLASPVQDTLIATRRPRPFADPSVAARVAGRVRGWELSAQYAFLHEKLPVYRARQGLVLALLPLALRVDGALTDEDRRQVATELVRDPLPVEGTYRRQHQAGLSVAGSLWRLGVSFDLAYLSREALTLGGALPLIDEGDGWLSTSVDSQVLAYTLGLTYVRGEEWLVTLEGWHRVYLDLVTRPAAERPQLLLGGPQQGGLALLARYRRALPASLELSAQLLALSDLANRSIILTPEVALRRGDHLQVGLGAAIYDGAEASLGGRLKRNTQLYVVLRAFL